MNGLLFCMFILLNVLLFWGSYSSMRRNHRRLIETQGKRYMVIGVLGKFLPVQSSSSSNPPLIRNSSLTLEELKRGSIRTLRTFGTREQAEKFIREFSLDELKSEPFLGYLEILMILDMHKLEESKSDKIFSETKSLSDYIALENKHEESE